MTQRRLFKATDLAGDPAYFLTMPDGTHKQVPGHEVRFEYHGETEKYFYQPSTPEPDALSQSEPGFSIEFDVPLSDTPDESLSLKELSNRFAVYVRSLHAADARIEHLGERLADAEDKIEELEKQDSINSGLVDALKAETLRTARDIGELRTNKTAQPLPQDQTPTHQVIYCGIFR